MGRGGEATDKQHSSAPEVESGRWPNLGCLMFLEWGDIVRDVVCRTRWISRGLDCFITRNGLLYMGNVCFDRERSWQIQEGATWTYFFASGDFTKWRI